MTATTTSVITNVTTPQTPGPMDDGLQDLGLPVPVQTFLWRQIAPFIRPKLGKLHEASCMVRFKN